ncbi:MAG: hypothetical protein O7E52_13000 [Candidatus Poribacteria bacterium]|nr:hypothetical protein [Candidatus Poribacteria bacterium]
MCKSFCYPILVLFVAGFIACGGSNDDDDADLLTEPAAQTPKPAGEITLVSAEVDFEAHEAAIREVFTSHAATITTEEVDDVMDYWFKSESREVFAAWTFWAGAFQQHEGWKGVKNGWIDIFSLRSGNMTVEIESIVIDKSARNARLRAGYRWADSGGLIAAMKKKDSKSDWKILSIDYTNEKFGKLIEEIEAPGYKNPAE